MTPAAQWTLVAACAAATMVLRAVGPVVLGGRALPAWFTATVTLMAPALLAALVVVSVLGDGTRLAVGPDTVGVAAGAVALWRRAPVVLAVFVAVAVTALLRAAGH